MLTYEELLAENRRLTEEVSKLKAENSELKAKLGIIPTARWTDAHCPSSERRDGFTPK